MKARHASLLLFLIASSACSPGAPDLAEYVVRSRPSGALVHLDGRFVGITSETGPLVIGCTPGRHQFRLGAEGRVDAVAGVEGGAGSRTALDILLPAPADPPTPPAAPVRIGPSQTLRARVRATGAAAGERPALSYVSLEAAGARRVLSILRRTSPLDIRIQDPNGHPVPTRTIPRPVAFPGEAFLEFTCGEPGDYRIDVAVPDGRAAAFALRYDAALPPIVVPEDPRMPGRRAPPPDLRIPERR